MFGWTWQTFNVNGKSVVNNIKEVKILKTIIIIIIDGILKSHAELSLRGIFNMTLKLLKLNPFKKQITNKRIQNSIRIKINYPLESEMTLINLRDNNLEEGKTKVSIENIGPGGLRFLSNQKLRVNQEIIYSFEAEISDDKIDIPGVIIWDEELSEGFYQYGLHFNLPERTRSFLIYLLNDYSKRYFSYVEA